jgi:putative membrane protein
MKISIIILAVIALMGCGANERNGTDKHADSTAVKADTVLTKNDQAVDLDTADVSFFEHAAYGGMIEVESSHKIVSLTLDSMVKRFADMMVTDHTAANAKLKALAEGKGYVLPVILPDSKLGLIDQLDSYKDEGRNEYYLKLMVEEHKKALALFSKASRSKDNDIRAFARATLPTLEHHYTHIQKIYDAFQQPKNNQGDDPLKLSDRKTQ